MHIFLGSQALPPATEQPGKYEKRRRNGMDAGLVNDLKDLAAREGVLMGVARAESLNASAPHGYRPKDMMPGAKSVIVFAKSLPLAAFLVPESYNNMHYQRSAYMYYLLMDNIAGEASIKLQEAGYPALPIPAYSPLRFHKGEPWGIISLKHAAQEAGLGVLGRSSLLINEKYGNIMRLGALMTEMPWPEYSPAPDFKPCSEKCTLCERACPIGAIRDGQVNKAACLGKCIKHVMLPPSFLMPFVKKAVASSKLLTRFMELVSLNFFETYGLGCAACLKACPHFPGKKKSTATA
jgi:epoxyqueuosine reductase